MVIRRACRSLILVATTSVAVACGLSGASDEDSRGPGSLDAGADVRIVEGGLQGDARGAGGNGIDLNPLCGPGSCMGAAPDDSQACGDFVIDGGIIFPPGGSGSGGAPAGGAGGSGGMGGTLGGAGGMGGTPGGVGGSTGERDAAADGSSQDASFPLDGGSTDAGDGSVDPAGGSGSADASLDGAADATAMADEPTPTSGSGETDGRSPYPAPTAPVFGCHIVVGAAGPEHRCDLAGRGTLGAACTSSRDCAPGLGCVGQERAAQCLPFCCRGATGCPTGTYCAERPLRLQDSTVPSPLVPVCVPADDCRLDEPFGCDPANNSECTCPLGQSCAIVRSDGTTACIEPGSGQTGDPCPCATGYFCSVSTERCIKTCNTDRRGQCGDGRCQATATFPAGIGLCVGTTEEGTAR